MGFPAPPVSFANGNQIKKMSGNTFHQGCFVAWMCYVLAMVRKHDGQRSIKPCGSRGSGFLFRPCVLQDALRLATSAIGSESEFDQTSPVARMIFSL